ncbi:hypothetical protein DFH06DRAFT_1307185 [Mycena polygramma]|nr:hypothetical protein DFH06DRAFT_1307185 [Mycena polygramma]
MPIVDSFLGVTYRDAKPEKVCQWHGCVDPNPARKMKFCAECTSVRYCSKECQKSDWPEHRLYCDVPPVLDLGQWRAMRLRSDPSAVNRSGLWVDIEAADRMINGVSPSQFYIRSLAVASFEDIQTLTRAPKFGPSFLGEGVVVFTVGLNKGIDTGKGQFTVHPQYHKVLDKLQGTDGPPNEAWKGIVKGVVNGDMPVSSLSRMIEDVNQE